MSNEKEYINANVAEIELIAEDTFHVLMQLFTEHDSKNKKKSRKAKRMLDTISAIAIAEDDNETFQSACNQVYEFLKHNVKHKNLCEQFYKDYIAAIVAHFRIAFAIHTIGEVLEDIDISEIMQSAGSEYVQ